VNFTPALVGGMVGKVGFGRPGSLQGEWARQEGRQGWDGCLWTPLRGQMLALPQLQAGVTGHTMVGVRTALRHSPAEALGCLSLPTVASRRGSPPLRHGEEPSLFAEGPV